MSLKALLLNFNLKGVGTYRRTYYFARELARRGHDVTMVTVSRERALRGREYFKRDWVDEYSGVKGEGPWVRVVETPGVGYRWLPGWGSGPLDIIRRVQMLIGSRYDVVWGFEHHPNVSWPVYLTRPFCGYRLLSDWCDWFAGASNTFRGWPVAHRIDGWFEEHIRKTADGLSVTSALLHDRALGIGIAPDRVVRIPEGAATDYVLELPRDEARARIGLPQGRPVVLAMRSSRMERELQVMQVVAKARPDVVGLFLGNRPPEATARAEQLGVAGNIQWTGWVSDRDFPWYLASADVCLCPLNDSLADRARWPAKLLDYLSAGRATVTNRVGEVATLLDRAPVARVAAGANDALAEAVLELLHDRVQADGLGSAARRHMIEAWDWGLRGPAICRMAEGGD